MFNFSGLLNRKYKKINGKVKFAGVRLLPTTLNFTNNSILVSTGYGLISSSEIEAARKSIRKSIGKSKKVKVLARIFPYLPLTGKPSEVRMGRGKGSRIRKWVSFIKPGKVLFEIRNVSFRGGNSALNKAAEKFSISSRVFRSFNFKSSLFK